MQRGKRLQEHPLLLIDDRQATSGCLRSVTEGSVTTQRKESRISVVRKAFDEGIKAH